MATGYDSARMRSKGQDDNQIARLTLVKRGLAVECDLIDEYEGKGLRYAATHQAPWPRGKVLGVYPRHAGLRTKRYHANLQQEAGLRGEYAMEVHNRVLYASPTQISVARINESSDPNVLFNPLHSQNPTATCKTPPSLRGLPSPPKEPKETCPRLI